MCLVVFFLPSFVLLFMYSITEVILLFCFCCDPCVCWVCVYECKFPKNENGGPSSVSLVKRRASIRRDDLYFVVAAGFFFLSS